MDILRILGPALLEVMVKTYLAYDIQSVEVVYLVTLWGRDFVPSTTYVVPAVHFIMFVCTSPPLLTMSSSSEERSLAAASNTVGAMSRIFAGLSNDGGR
jgi:hypothetical protein